MSECTQLERAADRLVSAVLTYRSEHSEGACSLPGCTVCRRNFALEAELDEAVADVQEARKTNPTTERSTQE